MKKYAVVFWVLGFVFVSAACWAVHMQGSAPSSKQDSSLSNSMGSFTVAYLNGNGSSGRRHSRGRTKYTLDNNSENYLLAVEIGRRHSRGRHNNHLKDSPSDSAGSFTVAKGGRRHSRGRDLKDSPNDTGYLLAGCGRRNSRGRCRFLLDNNSENYLLAQSGRRHSRGRCCGLNDSPNDAGYLLANCGGRRHSRGNRA